MTFQLQCFRSLWGTPSANALLQKAAANATASAMSAAEKKEYGARLIAHIAAQGYDGIEASLEDIALIGGSDHVQKQLQQHNLQLILGVYSGWVDYEPQHLQQQFEPVSSHLRRYREQLQAIDQFRLVAPTWINAHVGSDHWSKLDQMEFIAHALEIENDCGLHARISHETHRGRIFYSPWPTLELLEAFPSLKLTLDFSHWCVVTERLLDSSIDHEWIDNELLKHVYHVHGRIGSAQRAQVDLPRQSREEVDRFDRLWQSVWKHQEQRYGLQQAHNAQQRKLRTDEPEQRPSSTFTPEFGPIPYALSDPKDPTKSVVDIDQLCHAEATRQRQNFQQLFAK